ncbi:50S ribosomal protein L11 methyltransferase [Sporolactobacillus sp. THM19-2]|uniref:50S ribosomal protein L11 methyltransferase n=1 Tax=Sporolactobacillus sp. THM19-2 TaxID=2511171 RepID=UPI0010229BB6|nr:50S ribosomal protein L11 methyltransferase [Sporolactobacillus sp. THM19-2]RYL90392.1 50S ribosomal protein L11 methyltransferase [Sporolactobacillus sp. THM19-2]
MKWSEICIHTTEEAIEPVTGILYQAGAGGVVIEDSRDLSQDHSDTDGQVYDLDPEDYPTDGVNVKAYLPVNSFLGETVEEIRQALNNLLIYDIDPGENRLSISEHNEEEWATAWKKYYKPVTVGRSFIIIPTWIDYQPEDPKRQVIELDPGMAFGTGTHPTTVLCMEALENCLSPGAEVLDVGTGTGVLSITAAKSGAKHVLAVDLSDTAVRSARLNVRLNKVQKTVTVRQNNLIDHITETFDVITANLLAELVIRLIREGVVRHLRRKGYLIVSGIINTKKDQVRRVLHDAGLHVLNESEKGDWIALTAQKDF